jgi:hypothetical protein
MVPHGIGNEARRPLKVFVIAPTATACAACSRKGFAPSRLQTTPRCANENPPFLPATPAAISVIPRQLQGRTRPAPRVYAKRTTSHGGVDSSCNGGPVHNHRAEHVAIKSPMGQIHEVTAEISQRPPPKAHQLRHRTAHTPDDTGAIRHRPEPQIIFQPSRNRNPADRLVHPSVARGHPDMHLGHRTDRTDCTNSTTRR